MKVSVIIPVYNAEKYVREAVESALNQAETGEVILIEDASPDNALEVCQQLEQEYSQVTLFQHPNGENRGAGASRNLGIQNAQYDFIAFLDADDFYLPNHFKKPREIFESHGQKVEGVYEAVGTYFEDEVAKEKWFSVRNWTLTTVNTNVDPEYLLEAILTKGAGWFHTDGIVVHKSIFEKTGYFDEHLEIKQDSAMFLKMATIGRLLPGRLQDPVSMRRVHSSNRWMVETEKDRYYNLLLWETLFKWSYKKWGVNQMVTNEKVGIFWSRYINQILRKNMNDNNLVQYRIKRLLILSKMTQSFPKIVKLRQYWNTLVIFLGWEKIKKYLSKVKK